jgi:flagellar hook-length control protein FliK
MSPAYLSLEVAIAPVPKSGVDTSLIGVFDEALRQAARPDPRRPAAPAAETQSTFMTKKPQTSAKSEARVDHGTDEKRYRGQDDTPAAESGTRPSDEVGPAYDDSEHRISAKEKAETDETGEVADRDVATTISGVVPAIVGEMGQDQSGSETLELTPVDGEAPEPGSGAGGAQTTNAATVNVPAERPGLESEIEKTSQVTEPADGTIVAKVEEEANEEGESATAQTTVVGKRIEGKSDSEESAAEGTECSEESTEPRVDAEDETFRKASEKRKPGKQGEKYRAETVTKASGEAVRTDGSQMYVNAAGMPAELSQNEATERAAADPVAEPAPAADPGAASNGVHSTAQADGAAVGTVNANAVQSQSAAGRNSGKETTQGLDSAKFVQRVANAFSAVGQRNGSIRLKLYPPELGSLRMEITVKNGTLNARVEAETAAARSALVDNLPLLRERLAEQGIKVARFDVEVSDQSQGGPSERPDGGGQSFRQADRDGDSRPDKNTTETDSVEGCAAARLSVDGRLDVFI